MWQARTAVQPDKARTLKLPKSCQNHTPKRGWYNRYVRRQFRRKSAAASVSGIEGRQKVTAVIPAVRGAVAYAWYWGAVGSEKLGAVTTAAKVEISADAGRLPNRRFPAVRRQFHFYFGI
ncbi:hypothetical protein [Neisseria gonorrhoeae]|uniref:hypothetical protein n=1 Tax=Neisseria gonorrhoeae TaxID=485 RepID=UPI00223F299F|nr:hypothetical protein [Neisseria gonorrhoeae]UYP52440.1 hypothetical protein ND436_002615 [Neisseria gonorrhoeae]